jgi:two-component system alkaline phosphatase synthesis response regulator PhoP
MAKRILICDDEPHILESLSFVVRKAGFELLTATDGEEALKIAKEQGPDLILLDVMMPKLTGYEVCELLKKDTETRDIYIVMLTAKGQRMDEQQGMEAGANEYIKKPFSPRDLKDRLQEILG